VKKVALFIGPSGVGIQFPPAFSVYPPAAMGSVFRAVEEGYSTIAIVDGYFGNVGSSSMGALRAAELHQHGMLGVGVVFKLFARSILNDDDEVCVSHCPRELDYRPLTYAMVNLRFAFRRMRVLKIITKDDELRFVAHMKGLHFSLRDGEGLRQVLEAEASGGNRDLWKQFQHCYRDVKAADAERLVNMLNCSNFSKKITVGNRCHFPRTAHWRVQFENKRDDLPALGFDAGAFRGVTLVNR
jgi:hypothetical protein